MISLITSSKNNMPVTNISKFENNLKPINFFYILNINDPQNAFTNFHDIFHRRIINVFR